MPICISKLGERVVSLQVSRLGQLRSLAYYGSLELKIAITFLLLKLQIIRFILFLKLPPFMVDWRNFGRRARFRF